MNSLLKAIKFYSSGSLKLARSPYKILEPSDLEYFRTFLNPSQVVTDST